MVCGNLFQKPQEMSIHSREKFLVIKRNEHFIRIRMWLNWKIIMPRERSQTKNKSAYGTIPLAANYGDRKQKGVCLGW